MALPPSVAVGVAMAIDKESSGLPEVNVHRRTTKVNLSVIVAVLLFWALMIGVVLWLRSGG